MNFESQAEKWLEKIADLNKNHYEPSWNVEKCGHSFPLMQKMNSTSRTFLGIESKLGKSNDAAEYCYFYLCEELTLEKLDQYTTWITELEQVDVDKNNEQHCFSFISLVLLTNGPISKELQKKIKRYKHTTYYDKKKKEYGWSAGHLGVMDLQNNVIYCNPMGESLRTRLLGEQAEKQGLFSFLRKKN